ncbi:MAG TPA: MurR/RpiR family transcriptional regulator [Erysipelotrichaceae bacterium]|nr:MurR/RpiR family transcriptional regulator [Erysipelotrichaceae bacterium]
MSNNPFVLNQLLHITNDNYQKDANYAIAKTMLDHFYELPHMTIQEAADLCFVSTASISRFVRYLGYSGFSEFKISCEKSIGIEADYSSEVKKAGKEDLLPIYSRFTEQVVHNIETAFENLDMEQLDRICTRMKKADRIAVSGLEFSSVIGEHIQSRLARMGKIVDIGLNLNDQLEIAGRLTANSVVLLITMEGGYLYRNSDMLDILEKAGCFTVAFTINPQIKLLQFADEILVCGHDNYNTEARISLLYEVEMLLMHYSISFFQNY